MDRVAACGAADPSSTLGGRATHIRWGAAAVNRDGFENHKDYILARVRISPPPHKPL